MYHMYKYIKIILKKTELALCRIYILPLSTVLIVTITERLPSPADVLAVT